MANLSSQAKNSIDLFKGNSVSQIKRFMANQRQSVVNELMEYCGTKDMDTLAYKLSIGVEY